MKKLDPCVVVCVDADNFNPWITDEEIVHAAIEVYNAASDSLINTLIIPQLNEELYGDIDVFSEGPVRENYESLFYQGCDAAYLIVALSGLGKISGNRLVVPHGILTYNDYVYRIPIKIFNLA